MKLNSYWVLTIDGEDFFQPIPVYRDTSSSDNGDSPPYTGFNNIEWHSGSNGNLHTFVKPVDKIRMVYENFGDSNIVVEYLDNVIPVPPTGTVGYDIPINKTEFRMHVNTFVQLSGGASKTRLTWYIDGNSIGISDGIG